MSAEELHRYFCNTCGLSDWPKTHAVDRETFIDVFSTVFCAIAKDRAVHSIMEMMLGPNGGVHFKGVEILLEHRHDA